MDNGEHGKNDGTRNGYSPGEEHETASVKFVIDHLNDMFNKVPKGLASALRLASLCYNSHEIRRLVSLDESGCNFMHDISEACYALSHVDGNFRDRIYRSIRKNAEMFEIENMGERLA